MYLVNKCPKCGYQTPETQDWFCPIDKTKLNRNILIENEVNNVR